MRVRQRPLLVALWLSGVALDCSYFGTPPLHITTTRPGCVVVDLQHFGEYVAGITEITLWVGSTREIVWSATAPKGKVAWIATLELCVGENSIKPPMRGDPSPLDCRAPNSAQSFMLRSDTLYAIEIVDPKYRRRARAEFQFDARSS